MKRIIQSVKHLHWRMFMALLVMGLCPAIYTTARTYFLGQLPGDWAFSIAGQMSWVSLLYEVIDEALILPLFYFLGKAVKDRREFSNRLRTGLLVTLCIYSCLSTVMILFTEPLLRMMAASIELIEESVVYIRLECIACIFGVLLRFSCVALVALGRDKLVYMFTGAKLILCLITDSLLVSSLPFSANLGVNGIGVSNIVVNACLLILVLSILARMGYHVFAHESMHFSWTKELARIGGISGLESLVRNTAYLLMVARMVNSIGEQGTYWVANNFIWGWLLLPILQLGELIKMETAKDERAIQNNTVGYFAVTAIVCASWFVLVPFYKPFMRYVLNFDDVHKLFRLVMVLLGFYVLFALQNIFDATFYGRGKTEYMLFESLVTNLIYYGTAFVLFLTGIWVPTLTGIAIMFGLGNAFDSFVSGLAYACFLKKNKIDLLAVEEFL